MSTPRIFIGGDSWACGEWPEGPSLHTIHKGIEEYFVQDNYQVINTARGGASNQDSISLLFSTAPVTPSDIIIWVQTDPIRNLSFTELPIRLEQAGSIRQLMQELAIEDYQHLRQLANQYHCQVHCVGGLYSIQQELIADPVSCLVESWVRLLVPDYACNNWANYAILDSNWTIDHLELGRFKDQLVVSCCIDEMLELESNRQVFKHPIFFPNGNHPNREGHRILYNYIKERLKL